MSKSISLCTIVKNEELFIKDFIKNIKAYVDQIIIIDTGSTDNTVKIARGLGAFVFSIKWNDNFAEARNQALKYVNTDWVLVLDADEKLESDNKDILRELTNSINSKDIVIFSFPQYIYASQENLGKIQYKYSLFQNRKELKYEKEIHEILVNSDHQKEAKIIINNEVKVLNYGSIGTLERNKDKREKYLKALEICNNKYPDDIHYLYYFANFYYLSKEYDLCVTYINKALEVSKKASTLDKYLTDTYLLELYLMLLSIYMFQSKFQNIFDARYDLKERKIIHPIIFLHLGIASFKLNMFDFALEYLKLGFDIISDPNYSTLIKINKNVGCKFEYYIALSKLQLKEELEKRPEQILFDYLKENTEDFEIRNLLANLYLLNRQYKNAFILLKIEDSDKDGILTIAKGALTSNEDYTNIALGIANYYEKIHGEDIFSLKVKTQIYLLKKNYLASKSFLLKILQQDKDDKEIKDTFFQVLERAFPYEIEFYKKKLAK